MDVFLEGITRQAVNYAIRSGVTITASYALRQTGRLLSAVEKSSERDELQLLEDKLQTKIRIVSPAIDMIELISARGNTALESAVELTSRLRSEIQDIAQRLEHAATNEQLARQGSSRAPSRAELHKEMKNVISDLKRLLSHIEDAVPFLNLALTTSGAKLSTDLPTTISPSRLLQASTFLTAADSQYLGNVDSTVQVGPTFTLSLYMLFAGHVRPRVEEDVRESTWKEVIHKARVKLVRVPIDRLGQVTPNMASPNRTAERETLDPDSLKKIDEYAYQLQVIEDFDDDRMHDFEDGDLQPSAFEDVKTSGMKEAIPIHEVAKIFYADTGKILNIGGDGDVHRPVLLLKRDKLALAPRRIATRLAVQSWQEDNVYNQAKSDPVQSALDAQLTGASNTEREKSGVDEDRSDGHKTGRDRADPWGLPPDLDPEWLAFEVYAEAPDSEDEEQENSPDGGTNTRPSTDISPDSRLTQQFAGLKFRSPSSSLSSQNPSLSRSLMLRPDLGKDISLPQDPMLQIRTSLSLLEVLLRLTSLQQFQQSTHLAIEDEFLNFFLSESSTTGGVGGDEHERRALREEARRRVGFDPYDESPIKRRGEDYQYRGGASQAGWDGDREVVESIEEPMPSPQSVRQSSGSYRRHSHRLSGTDFPPMRLRNSPRSSRQATPEKRQSASSFPTPIMSPNTGGLKTRSQLSHQVPANDESAEEESS